MAKSSLVIVESPAKAKTIGKYLGPGYQVKACMGHLRDLPKSTLSVDIENNFEPNYRPIKGKEDIINDLKKSAKASELVYLATDPDREGEAISWHLKELLGLSDEKARRVTFNEITKRVVNESIAQPREIDQSLVDAQQARRILDRIVGYQLSPLLWKKIRSGLSAGRVQSVATRMVCDREHEIAAFQPQEYWSLDAKLSADGTERTAFLAHYHGENGKKKELNSIEEVEAVVEAVKNAAFAVRSVKRQDKQRSPSPPFTTSTLQQEASRKLSMTPRRTMAIAQQLYEGEAPCLITKDGGETWEKVDLPDVQVLSIGPAGPNTQTIVMEVGRYEEGPVTCFMRSPDMGDTWYLSYPTYPATTIQADLDHDGILEDLSISRFRRDAGYDFWSLLWLSQREKPDKPAAYHRDSWTGMAATVHPDWTAYFLCRMDGEDYLLQYTPYMSCGLAEYSYKLFYLTVYGEEVVVQENSLEFDINFESDQADRHQFDPRAISAFMEEINALLASSEQLVNTDEYLQETFHKEGRLYDSLGWLDGNEYGFSRDENRSLLENLLVYRNKAVESAAFPYVSEVLFSLRKEDIRMMSWGGTNMSYRRSKSLVADTLNGLAGKVEYLTGVDGDFSRGGASIGYVRNGSETQHTILLEITETDELENLVRITCAGEMTVLIYSENPDNDSHYLRSVPYSITAYVEDETLYRMVYCNDALWED